MFCLAEERSNSMESDAKLKELSLYIAERSKNDPYFGATKLNKILFASDFFSYGQRGKSITDAEYAHRNRGPTPHRMPLILEALKTENRGIVEETTFFGHTQKRLIALTGADTSAFREDELRFVDSVIDYFRSWNATQLSEWTHTLLPWLLTREGEKIPYYTVFSLRQKTTIEQEAIDWAKEEIKRLAA